MVVWYPILSSEPVTLGVMETRFCDDGLNRPFLITDGYCLADASAAINK